MNSTHFNAIAKPILMALVSTIAVLLAACAPMPPAKPIVDAGPMVFPPPPEEPRFVFERTIYGSGDIMPETTDSKLRGMLTGEGVKGEGLNKPNSIAVFQGRIFVADSVEAVIRVFDVPNGHHYKIGFDDPGKLSKPLGIDVDRQGNLYVADNGARAIFIYNKEGKFLRKIGDPKWFDRLANVTVDPKGDRIYLVDVGGVSSQQHRVRVVDATSGEPLFDFGARGKDPGDFNFPRDMVVGKDARLYIVDSGNFRVQIFDRDGKFLKTFGNIGRQLGQFSRPKEIASDPSGNIYVTDTAFGNFQIFNPEGELLMFVGNRSEQDGPARYMLPAGIYVDEDGRVYMVDQWFRKVDIFRPYNLKADAGYLGKRPGTKPGSR